MPSMNRGEERRAVLAQVVDGSSARVGPVELAVELRPSGRGGRRRMQVIGQVQRDAAVALAERLDADPDHFARRHQRVEHRGLVVRDARRQDLALEHRCRERRALQLLDGVEQRLEPAPRRADAVPRHRKRPSASASTGSISCRSLRERAAAQAAQDVGVDPLALGAARPELAFDQPARFGQPRQQRFGDRDAEAVARRQLARR